jgi:diadenosine tetraphosphate (Ap4A) HIT family hydrolase
MSTGDSYYFQFDIKRYTHWTLRVEEKQCYLGQVVVWLEREGDMQRLSSLSDGERSELWEKVLPDYEHAVAKLWQPDHMNYAWLGNLFNLHNGHGHMHMIPRYSAEREFAGLVFTDPRWGKNYVPYETDERSIDVAFQVRDALRAEIPNSHHE